MNLPLRTIDQHPFRWAYLLHPTRGVWQNVRDPAPCDPKVWDTVVTAVAGAGANCAVIDLGNAVAYRSHPEIADPGAWSRDELVERLDQLRDLGLEPIPKLNFSSVHLNWMGDYARMVSSQPFYAVCRDLIDEVCELFDGPALFHLGLDEETIYTGDPRFEYVVGRRRNLWWHDAEFLFDCVTRNGPRPWMWADESWSKVGEYHTRMSTQVLQSNWFYHEEFPEDTRGRPRPLDYRLRETYLAFDDLEDHGFDQIPCGSTWLTEKNFASLVEYCSRVVDPERLKGYLMASWIALDRDGLEANLTAVDTLAAVIQQTQGGTGVGQVLSGAAAR